MAGEVLLVRLLSLRFWPHLVPLVISQAMLGLGAAGVALQVLRRRVARAPAAFFAWSVVAAAPSLDLAHRASLLVPLDPFLLLWQASAWPAFVAYFVVLSVPFFLAGLATGTPLAFALGRTGTVYAASFAGSAAGAGVSLAALAVVPSMSLPRVVTALGLGAALLVVRDPAGKANPGRVVAAATALLLLVIPPAVPVMSPYKDLAIALRLPGAEIVAARSGPSGDYRALLSPAVHTAPGLSLSYQGDLPPQALVFRDGETGGVVPISGSRGPPDYLAHLPAAFWYQLLDGPAVLQIGLRGTEGVLAAAANGARSVTVVEPAAEAVALVDGDLARLSGSHPENPSVEILVAPVRPYLARETRTFDLVELGDVSSLTFASLGVHAAGESFGLTREGIRASLARAGETGLLAFSGWLKTPPRESVKALATVRAELETSGAAPAAERIVVVRGWGTFAAAARRRPFAEEELDRVRRFCEQEGFALAWPPSARNDADAPGERAFSDALERTLLGGEGASGGLFHLEPATDDVPYFHRFLRLGAIPEFRRALGSQWAPLVEWGVLFQLLSLPIALGVAALTLVAPVLRRGAARGRLRDLGCFAALGVAYMLIELTWLKAGVLVAPSAAAAAASALGGFTFFSGLGSAVAARLAPEGSPLPRWLFPALFVATAGGFLAFRAAAPPLLAAGDGARLLAFFASLAPAAFLMGVPFPTALGRLARLDAAALPLALGVNGFFSVAGATLASLAALWLGFRATALIGAALYLVAAALFPRARRR